MGSASWPLVTEESPCHVCGKPLSVPKEATLLARACWRCQIPPTPETDPVRARALRELRAYDYE